MHMCSVYAMCNLPAMNHNNAICEYLVGYKTIIHSCICAHLKAFTDISMCSTRKNEVAECMKLLLACELIHPMNQYS